MRFPFEHLAPLFRGQKLLFARFIVTALARAGASLTVILLVRHFLSATLGESGGRSDNFAGALVGPAGLWSIATLLISTYVAGSLFNYDNQVVRQRIIKVIELGMMERLIRHLLTLSVTFFDRQNHGDLIQALRQDVTVFRGLVLALTGLFFEATLAAALLLSALWISPSLTLWALIVVPAAMLPIYLVARRTLAQSYRVRRTGYVLFNMILQILQGIRVIKAYQGADREAQEAVDKGQRFFDEQIEMTRASALVQVVLESIAGLGTVVIIVVGGFQVMHGTLGWPALLAFFMAVRALHGPLYAMNMHYVQIQASAASVERIAELLATPPEVVDRPKALPLSAGPKRIVFDHVTFTYDRDTVLQDLSFEVAPGETLGIAGPSGAGKTTLLNLIVRFYDPTAGCILFDGRDVRDYRLADVYDQFAIVTQSPFLFATTVRENIRVGRPAASDLEVEAAARAAEVHEEILALPEGYGTAVGLAGRPLSTGQAQRINVARAILKNAPLLLLDEATSSLDSLSEAKVQRAIDRLAEGRTSVVVAHRLSTLRGASRILVLESGRAVGLGSHEALLRECRLYRRMWETQLLEDPGVSRNATTHPAQNGQGAMDIPVSDQTQPGLPA
jgi:subfamily B ATP-binding cassette protein MsbA